MSVKNQTRAKKVRVKTAKGRKIGSTKWLSRHINDPYVQLAKEKGYRSRAAFKLIEIFEKFPLNRNAKFAVDLGCAPGGWLQVLREKSKTAKIIGVDLQDVEPIDGVSIIKGDIETNETLDELIALCDGKKADLVVSDMAAASSGDPETDHLRLMSLIDMALCFCETNLETRGNFVAKYLRGREEQILLKKLKENFESVKLFKPDASYKDSSEIYLICLNYRK